MNEHTKLSPTAIQHAHHPANVTAERTAGQRHQRLRQQHHPECIVCGQAGQNGLSVQFRATSDGRVEAEFACQRVLQGYPHVLHGGVICSLLDGAMTNCVFASGEAAVTGDLHVRFHKPVAANGQATVRAWIEASCPPLYKLGAELEQNGEIKATATARFVQRTVAARWLEGHRG